VANCATNFASVVDTGGKFAAGINDAGGNLPPVSTTPAAICHRYQRRRRQFATSINDAGGNLPPVSTTPVANNGTNIRLLRP
jgi:hypothetical protein